VIAAERVAAIRAALQAQLAPSHIAVGDDSAAHAGHAGARGGAGHFHVQVVSERFRGRSRIERHRLIYEAVQNLMGSEIHALAIEALAPEEFTS